MHPFILFGFMHPFYFVWVYAPASFFWVYAPAFFGFTHPYILFGFMHPFVLFGFTHPYILFGFTHPFILFRFMHLHLSFGFTHPYILFGFTHPFVLFGFTHPFLFCLGLRTRIFPLGFTYPLVLFYFIFRSSLCTRIFLLWVYAPLIFSLGLFIAIILPLGVCTNWHHAPAILCLGTFILRYSLLLPLVCIWASAPASFIWDYPAPFWCTGVIPWITHPWICGLGLFSCSVWVHMHCVSVYTSTNLSFRTIHAHYTSFWLLDNLHTYLVV